MTRLMATPVVIENTLSAETSGSPYSMDVSFLLSGEVVVDDEVDLLDVDSSGEEVGGDEDSGAAGPELLHDEFPLVLVHSSVL